MPKEPRPCKYCGIAGTHFEFACFQKPKKPRVSYKSGKLIERKPISPKGKQFKAWLKTKDKWLEQNKAPYYFCYLCGKSMTRTQLTLDHVIPRSRAPELRHVLSNLKPCCLQCNYEKGSKVLDKPLN